MNSFNHLADWLHASLNMMSYVASCRADSTPLCLLFINSAFPVLVVPLAAPEALKFLTEKDHIYLFWKSLAVREKGFNESRVRYLQLTNAFETKCQRLWVIIMWEVPLFLQQNELFQVLIYALLFCCCGAPLPAGGAVHRGTKCVCLTAWPTRRRPWETPQTPSSGSAACWWDTTTRSLSRLAACSTGSCAGSLQCCSITSS